MTTPTLVTPPRFITPRRSPYSYAGKVAMLAEVAFGRPFMPWQHEASGLIEECDADGWLLNSLVIITVPRQSGKTELVKNTTVRRMMARKRAQCWYTAQTGIKAREQFIELIDDVELSPLRSALRGKRGASDTSLTLARLGSKARAFPPTGDSLHGNQSDLVVIDEGWKLSEEEGEALMGAVVPTQATRGRANGVLPGPQTIIISTAGTAASTWFHNLVDMARAGMPGVALVDYGIADGLEATDENIAAAHPAIGYTQGIDILETARAQLSPGEFVRAYGNRRTAAAERLISPELVELATVTTDLPDGPASFGAAVSYDRDETVIVACVLDPDGVPWCEVLHVLPGTEGAAALLAGEHVMIAGEGPGASIADQLDTAGEKVVVVTGAELSNSTGDLLDRIRRPETIPGSEPGVRLRSHPSFTQALEVAALRNSGDRQAWARRGSAGSVAALEAATLAIRAALNRPRPPVKPMTRIWSD